MYQIQIEITFRILSNVKISDHTSLGKEKERLCHLKLVGLFVIGNNFGICCNSKTFIADTYFNNVITCILGEKLQFLKYLPTFLSL